MPFVHPFRKKLCPFCFNEFHLSDCAIVSAIEDPKTGKHPIIQPPPRDLMARFWIPSPSGTKHASRMARWRCPHCGMLLPLNSASVSNRIIALVGGTGSGKSTYISSLIAQLRRGKELREIGCTEFMAMNSKVDNIYDNHYHRFTFIDKCKLPGTLSKPVAGEEYPYHKPLVYSLVFQQRAGKPPQSINLVLFDASGEEFESDERLTQFTQYVMHAAAIIFLIDPMSIPGLREQILPYIRGNAQPGMEARSVMDNVVRVLRQSTGSNNVSIPVVLTLTKSDLLKYPLALLPGDYAADKSLVLRDPDYSRGFQVEEYYAVSRQVEEVLNRFNGPALSEQRRIFPNLSFSAVSATGCAPDEQEKYKFIKPMRCLDPLFWIFWQLALIEPARPVVQRASKPSGATIE